MICAKSDLEQAFCWCFCFYPHVNTDPRPAGCCPASSGSASQLASRSWSSRGAVWVKWAVLFSFSFSLHPSSWWVRGQCAGPPSGALGWWSLWWGWRWPHLWTGCLWRERSGTLLAPPRWPWSSCRSPVCPAARWSRSGSCLSGGPSEGWQTGQIKCETKGFPFSPLQVFVGRKISFMLIVWNKPARVIWIIRCVLAPVFLLPFQP